MVVLGKNHFIADLPEYKLFLQQQKHHPQQQRVKQILKRFKNVPSNKIVPITTTTEENLLCYKNFSNQVTEVNFVEDVFSNNQSSIPSFQHHKRNNNSSYKIIDHNHNRLRYENEPHSSRPICRYHYKPHHHNHKSNHQKLSHKSGHHKFSHNGHKSGHHSSKSDQKTQHSQQHQQRHKHHHKSQKTSKSRKQDSHQRHLANHKLPCVPPRRAHLSRDDITLKSLAIGILNIAVSHSNPSLLRRLEKAYKHALLTGLWLNTDAATDVQSYFVSAASTYFLCLDLTYFSYHHLFFKSFYYFFIAFCLFLIAFLFCSWFFVCYLSICCFFFEKFVCDFENFFVIIPHFLLQKKYFVTFIFETFWLFKKRIVSFNIVFQPIDVE